MAGINGDWRWDILEQLLPMSALLHIAAMKALSLSCLVDAPRSHSAFLFYGYFNMDGIHSTGKDGELLWS
ncbi:hypothetical protein V6N13_020277 [Hibiscus sabdariffa]